MKTKIIEIKQGLISQFEILKNQYPDCFWLQECISMNQPNNMTSCNGITIEARPGCSVRVPPS
jgi:hypothetical protein